ncbi:MULTISPECIES: glycoside hydrolase family 36 protein [unclassified Marinitoga]|uniref:glycoside hydrolase family 36 protein n=1 Tax=unclassified Marinitoga TaxID=2640159 RepID=UPI000657C36B|nr:MULTISPECIES: alpha-galactosidase [unclassified Marinitoga]KLO24591.1 alpha-galactosidase [Marinitoga sp. 1155]
MNIFNIKYIDHFLEIKNNNYILRFYIEKIPEGFIVRGKIKGKPGRIEIFRDIGDRFLFINNWQSSGSSKVIDTDKYYTSHMKKSKCSDHIFSELIKESIVSDYFLGKKNALYGFLTSKIAHPFFIIKNNEIIGYLDYFDKIFDDFTNIESFIYLENMPLEKLLEIYADYVKAENNIKFSKWKPVVWSSKYLYLKKFKWNNILKNLELSKDFKYDVFQLDDSWQKDIGDWIPKDSFPKISEISKTINNYGYITGLWLAPFSISETSEIFKKHKEWLIKDENNLPKVAYIYFNKKIYALDTTHPDAQEYIKKTFLYLKNNGIQYFKIDFLFSGATPGKRYLNVTPIEAYHIGMKIIKESLKDNFILGCKAPLLTSFNYVDGMEIGTSPHCNIDDYDFVYPYVYSLKNTISKFFINEKWWWNNPSCLLLNTKNSGLNSKIVEMYAYVSSFLNNMTIQCDDLSKELKKDIYFKTLKFRNGTYSVKGLMNINNEYEIISYLPFYGRTNIKINLNNIEYKIFSDIEYPELEKTIKLKNDKRLFYYYSEKSDNNA